MDTNKPASGLAHCSDVFPLNYRRHRRRIRHHLYRYAPGDYVRPYRPRISLGEIARVLFFVAIVLVILCGMIAEHFEGEPLPARATPSGMP